MNYCQRREGKHDVEPAPPCGLVTRAMQLAMVDPQTGTMNSSLTRRPSARGWIKVRWCGSEGTRAAYEAGLSVVLIAQANFLTQTVNSVAAGRCPAREPEGVGGRSRLSHYRITSDISPCPLRVGFTVIWDVLAERR
jgi:hypothetical protein